MTKHHVSAKQPRRVAPPKPAQQIDGVRYVVGELWTASQRRGSNLHEVSYRACFKPQLPAYFIERFSKAGDRTYDPFSGRGTTAIEAARMGRNVIANDANPISNLLAQPRLSPPEIEHVEERLDQIRLDRRARADRDLSMFYAPATEGELTSLKKYLRQRRSEATEDELDAWIRMVATSRLSGHSAGFFSVYTLPPNQAVSPERQILINRKLRQKPVYRDVRALILRKTKQLLKGLSETERSNLRMAAKKALFLTDDAACTPAIKDASVRLTVTSPPFLDVVSYASDNWLRAWFNDVPEAFGDRLTNSRTPESWTDFMGGVLRELFRVTTPGGFVAIEVGEVRNGRIELEKLLLPAGERAGFKCETIYVNKQAFTKTAHIWGVANNKRGTNSNRIVLFRK